MRQRIPSFLRSFSLIALVLTFSSGCDTSDLPSSASGLIGASTTGTQPGATPTQSPVSPPPSPTTAGPDQYQQQLLDLINASRATVGLPPYPFSSLESNGTATCVGSLGHSVEMSQEGAISHDQFPADICVSFASAGENVGYTSGVSESDGIAETHQAMMNEGPSGGHYQNIMSSSFTTVGIGLYVDSAGTLWLTEDFVEP
jgi:uncharacterized protein YkwD